MSDLLWKLSHTTTQESNDTFKKAHAALVALLTFTHLTHQIVSHF